ncbi:MAG: SDR family oxidoreductase [Pseudomonadota bacterium]
MTDLSGKAVLITGASRGIGAAAAREFASRGARVTMAARSLDPMITIAREIEADGGEVQVVACDVAEYAHVQDAVDRTVRTYGSLDVMVNNAGLIDPIAPIADSDPAEWSRMFNVNATGTYHGIRAALPVMKAQGGGTILNISSGAATSPLEGWSHYCASKAAALMLTRCAHKEAGQTVRVIGLSPGTVATEMQVRIKDSGINPVSQLDWSAHIPPAWPAKALVWLCGPDGAEFAGGDVSLRDEDVRRRIGLIA